MTFAKKKKKKYIVLIFILAFIGAIFMLNKFDSFEKDAPIIYSEDVIYYNLKNPINLRVADEKSKLSSLKLTLKKDQNDSGVVILNQQNLAEKDFSTSFTLPKTAYKEQVHQYTLIIEASDSSWWNFFSGNKALKNVQILIDDKSPKIEVLSASYQITKGGAAGVVFLAQDLNLQEVFIQVGKQRFIPTPYLKDDYYASLLAWDVQDENFEAYIIAKDKAGNESKVKIPLYLQNKKYKNSNIALSDKFLDGKIKDLAQQYAPRGSNFNRLEQFKFVNETLRLDNEKRIHELSYQKSLDQKMINDFKINLFLPLKNGMKVADFADHRFYSYDGQFVSDSYHLGLDLASVARANIITNNDGVVVFARENGIYGTNILIDHGFGLFTLYGHCTQSFVQEGDFVKAGQSIATTGVSGLALGDHLHFGVLIQGVEVRPEEWQDRKWIQNSITKVLDEAKKIILAK